MKKFIFLSLILGLLITACQKPASVDIINRPIGISGDSIISQGDSLTYEVLTTDPGGWFGVWNGSDGVLTSNGLTNNTWGEPNYLSSGWKYTFVVPNRPFQAFISVFTKLFATDITVNLYKNGQLIKTAPNPIASKLIVTAQTDSLVGTATNPVVTYQVLITDPDPTKSESDAWIGQWNTPAGVVNDLNDRLQSSLFPMCSGWKYSFRPDHLPFRMYLAGSPFIKDGGKITINFLVNGQLVRTASARDWIYGFDYIVQ